MRDRYASLREGLVGAWIPSVSGSGLLLPDLSGNGNNGTLTNMGPEDWVSSQYGRALDFDGVNDSVNLDEYAAKFSLLSTGTLTGWFRARSQTTGDIFSITQPSTTGNRSIVVIGQSTGNLADESLAIGFVKNGTVQYFGCVRKGHTFYQDDSWHCFAWIGSDIGNSLYVDGVKQTLEYQFGSSTATGFFNATNISSMYIGRRNLTGFPNNNFNGQLDDIRIYNRVLSEPEIKLLASRPGIGLRPQRRTMYYAPPTGARRRRILTSMP